ncbi:thiamine diphosphate-binding protein [Aspergillus alliaceus]|uniref:thiamine diphosphate-binding protein n=1 Tax=Petromyces alliaceus TaxID=209559 RepID=UPI0012A56797|nr:thiamine diphosphate-binding protein [Aspergillus alliaceus]KAB8227058.1 thiamine diphosphate-binding protein [Aspergillus alliaceus]
MAPHRPIIGDEMQMKAWHTKPTRKFRDRIGDIYGPGTSNVVTPMLDALLDGTPMAVICGQAAPTIQGTGAFQEIYVVSLAQSCTRWCTCVDTVASLPGAIGADRVVKLINQSQRPVTCAGNGVHSSYDGPALLSQVAEQACIPVATTLLGLGSFDETHNLALHMMGTYGTPYANCTLSKMSTLLSQSGRARSIVQLDINADTVGKDIHPTDLAIGDLSVTLQILLPQLVRHDRAEWLSQIQHWKAEYSLRIPNTKEPQQYSLPQQILTELGHQIETIKHRTILTAGVGQPQMWAAQRYRWRYSRSLITSGSLGAMEFGLPAAIGAHLAKPDHLVIDVDGDASLCMTIEELLTASQYDIPVKVVLFNNRQQAMITQLQQKNYNGCVCHPRQANPDFVRLAQSTGCQGRQCFRLDTLPENMEWLLNCEGPAMLDVIVEDIDMKPIVSTGGSLDKVELELRLRARVIVKHSFS